MIYDFSQLAQNQDQNGQARIKSRISNLEGKVNAILTLTAVEFVGFIALAVTLISKI